MIDFLIAIDPFALGVFVAVCSFSFVFLSIFFGNLIFSKKQGE